MHAAGLYKLFNSDEYIDLVTNLYPRVDMVVGGADKLPGFKELLDMESQNRSVHGRRYLMVIDDRLENLQDASELGTTYPDIDIIYYTPISTAEFGCRFGISSIGSVTGSTCAPLAVGVVVSIGVGTSVLIGRVIIGVGVFTGKVGLGAIGALSELDLIKYITPPATRITTKTTKNINVLLFDPPDIFGIEGGGGAPVPEFIIVSGIVGIVFIAGIGLVLIGACAGAAIG